ncbi:hypothetical protein KI387_043243, partial [Taxus chinensis]
KSNVGFEAKFLISKIKTAWKCAGNSSTISGTCQDCIGVSRRREDYVLSWTGHQANMVLSQIEDNSL